MSFWKKLLGFEEKVKPYEKVRDVHPEPALTVTINPREVISVPEEPVVEGLTEFPELPEGYEWAVKKNLQCSKYSSTISQVGYKLTIIDRTREFDTKDYLIVEVVMEDPKLVTEWEKDCEDDYSYYYPSSLTNSRYSYTHYRHIDKAIILTFAADLAESLVETIKGNRDAAEKSRLSKLATEASDSFLGTYPPNDLDKPERGKAELVDQFGLTDLAKLAFKVKTPDMGLSADDAVRVWKAWAGLQNDELKQFLGVVSCLSRETAIGSRCSTTGELSCEKCEVC